MRQLIRVFVLSSLLIGSFAVFSPAHAQPYFYRWTTPPPLPSCTFNGTDVVIVLGPQPFEWDLPVDNEIIIVNIANGVESPSSPFTWPAGVGTLSYAAITTTVSGGYPITYAIRLETYVGGSLVYKSTLAFICTGDTTAAAISITNEEITPGTPPGSGGQTAPVAGPDLVAIPDTAVVGAVVSTTPIYFAPESGAASVIFLEAGKTVWVFGVDASGDFYRVMLSGRFFWVPVKAMGPNFDAVWQGRPLPTGTVE